MRDGPREQMALFGNRDARHRARMQRKRSHLAAERQRIAWNNEARIYETIPIRGDRILTPVKIIDIMISIRHQELPVAQVIVRNLEDAVKVRLKRRAVRHGHSLEEEVRNILRDAVKDQNQHLAKLGSRIAARFAKVGLTRDLPELHGQVPRLPEFGK
jgi:plasmid stability protein